MYLHSCIHCVNSVSNQIEMYDAPEDVSLSACEKDEIMMLS